MVLLNLGLAGLEYFVGLKTGIPPKKLAGSVAARLKKGGVLTQKVAQIIASRPDVVTDAHMLRELRTLQSHETSPGVFEASIAVVHVDPTNGIAIKTLRDSSVHGDGKRLKAALKLAEFVSARFPQMNVVTDTLHTLAQELDLEAEYDKNALFISSLEGCVVTKIPVTISSTKDAVVMEYVPSTLAKDITTPVDIGVVNTFFREMVLAAVSTGILHLDLHSGNVGVSPDGRSIVVYDMGSIRKVDNRVTCKACVSFAGAAEFMTLGEWEQLASHLVQNGILVSVKDVSNLKLMAEVAVRYSAGDATTVDIGRCMQVVKGDVNLSYSVYQLMQCMSILEGTCKVLNPGFNVSEAFSSASFFLRFGQIIETAILA